MTSAALQKETELLSYFVNAIMNKPKPKVETPKEAPAPEKKDTEPMEEDEKKVPEEDMNVD